jgi:hypothetical protein
MMILFKKRSEQKEIGQFFSTQTKWHTGIGIERVEVQTMETWD